MNKERVGIYAGSFNPFHIGHLDVLNKALEIFDKVILLQVIESSETLPIKGSFLNDKKRIIYDREFNTKLLTATIDEWELLYNYNITIVRGVRNSYDLDYEFNLNRTYNDIAGRKIPFILIPTAPQLSHVSSSMVRSLQKIGQDVSMYLEE